MSPGFAALLLRLASTCCRICARSRCFRHATVPPAVSIHRDRLALTFRSLGSERRRLTRSLRSAADDSCRSFADQIVGQGRRSRDIDPRPCPRSLRRTESKSVSFQSFRIYRRLSPLFTVTISNPLSLLRQHFIQVGQLLTARARTDCSKSRAASPCGFTTLLKSACLPTVRQLGSPGHAARSAAVPTPRGPCRWRPRVRDALLERFRAPWEA